MDYSGYQDCKDTLIMALNATLDLPMNYDFRIRMLLMWLTKV